MLRAGERSAEVSSDRNGLSVVATGAIGIWERRSEYQLRVVEVALLGAGAIAAKVEALRKRLQAEGLFDQSRKRVFARFPRRVALVSARGKGAADFESTLREKAPNVTVLFVETRVQGDGAEIDIAEAIDRASRVAVDAIVVLRGGGSYEDRYPFNTEPVVRAIVRSRHPVVTAHRPHRRPASRRRGRRCRLQDADRGCRAHRRLVGGSDGPPRATARTARRRDRTRHRATRAASRSCRSRTRSRHRAASLRVAARGCCNCRTESSGRILAIALGLRQNRLTAVLLKIDGARDRLLSPARKRTGAGAKPAPRGESGGAAGTWLCNRYALGPRVARCAGRCDR